MSGGGEKPVGIVRAVKRNNFTRRFLDGCCAFVTVLARDWEEIETCGIWQGEGIEMERTGRRGAVERSGEGKRYRGRIDKSKRMRFVRKIYR